MTLRPLRVYADHAPTAVGAGRGNPKVTRRDSASFTVGAFFVPAASRYDGLRGADFGRAGLPCDRFSTPVQPVTIVESGDGSSSFFTRRTVMTSQLIPFETRTVAGESVQTVNARELHAFLGAGKMFAHWIKARIDEYGFLENQDFVSFCQNGQKPQGGRPSIEYYLTIDMAKELAMVERTPKGRAVRQYFIECERQLRAGLAQQDVQQMKLMLTNCQQTLLQLAPEVAKLVQCRRIGLKVCEIGRVLGLGERAVSRRIKVLKACGLVSDQPTAGRQLSLWVDAP